MPTLNEFLEKALENYKPEERIDEGVDFGNEKNIKKIENDFSKIAKEKIKVEFIKSAYYGFGSELATLRLLFKYTNKGKNNPNGKFDAGYSSNMKKYYFRMDV